jgi:hypothetical protein
MQAFAIIQELHVNRFDELLPAPELIWVLSAEASALYERVFNEGMVLINKAWYEDFDEATAGDQGCKGSCFELVVAFAVVVGLWQ